MSDDLKSDLTNIDGVGDATAEKILAVLSEHDTATDPYVEKAKAAADAGDTHAAVTYLQRAGDSE